MGSFGPSQECQKCHMGHAPGDSAMGIFLFEKHTLRGKLVIFWGRTSPMTRVENISSRPPSAGAMFVSLWEDNLLVLS